MIIITTATILTTLKVFGFWLYLMAINVCTGLVYFRYKNEDWRKARNAGALAFGMVLGSCYFGYIVLPDFLKEIRRP